MSAPPVESRHEPDEAPANIGTAYFVQRTLLPGFKEMLQAGAFRYKAGDRDITDIISEDRDGTHCL